MFPYSFNVIVPTSTNIIYGWVQFRITFSVGIFFNTFELIVTGCNRLSSAGPKVRDLVDPCFVLITNTENGENFFTKKNYYFCKNI